MRLPSALSVWRFAGTVTAPLSPLSATGRTRRGRRRGACGRRRAGGQLRRLRGRPERLSARAVLVGLPCHRALLADARLVPVADTGGEGLLELGPLVVGEKGRVVVRAHQRF